VAKAFGLRQNNLSSGNSSGNKRKLQKNSTSRCEVCNNGGELICCETCSLAFHLKCIRPKIKCVPKGRWTCSHCIMNGVSSAESTSFLSAQLGVMEMTLMSRGVDSNFDDAELEKRMYESYKTKHELTVQRSGKRFVVRRTSKSQIVELDRCSTLEEALTAVAAEINPVTHKKKPFEEDELWCVHCLDDPKVTVCAFCGCRKCHGKHDSESLLVCDGCDEEYHTYCLTKPLEEIPQNSWYCTCCSKKMHKKAAKETEKVVVKITGKEEENASKSTSSSSKVKTVSSPTPTSPRGRGRPPGSSKKNREAVLNEADADKGSADTSNKGGSGANGSASSGSRNRSGSGSSSSTEVKDATFACRIGNDPSSSSPESPKLAPTLGPPGYEEAVAIANGKYSGDLDMFHSSEIELLKQVVLWAPIGDLEVTYDALVARKDEICRRITALDPFFKFVDITSSRSIEDSVKGADAADNDDVDDNGDGFDDDGEDVDDEDGNRKSADTKQVAAENIDDSYFNHNFDAYESDADKNLSSETKALCAAEVVVKEKNFASHFADDLLAEALTNKDTS
jgi:hypothetical protein